MGERFSKLLTKFEISESFLPQMKPGSLILSNLIVLHNLIGVCIKYNEAVESLV